MVNSEEEIWKPLPGVLGVEVSTFGRVQTLDRTVPRKSGTYHVKGRVLKPWDNGNGYLLVHIPIDGKQAKKLVHRLVAQTFISDPDSLPEVNHKDNDRTNNHVNNLEFCTHEYNSKYRQKYEILTASLKADTSKLEATGL
ncbi:NUMOD4 domain-containing protein [Lactobacillus acetotolerans]|uniref:NUMOD4 domain-containing protein n=1 Tax=Lactobacillus acetotolerans TaxID=1600 RepID=UPI002FD89029